MLNLELTQEQAAILREYLRRELADLSVEIAGTDRLEYRQSIKAERQLLEEIVDRLSHHEHA